MLVRLVVLAIGVVIVALIGILHAHVVVVVVWILVTDATGIAE